MSVLREPSFYPHHPDGVELRETHISWVFLAGTRAYKVKKPVTLPFLDYGTLERRRAFCHDEVHLNRRLAPDLYLGVRSLVRQGGDLRLAGPDEPGAIEFAVEMRRFSEERTLGRLLGGGEAGSTRLEAVGRRLGAFHRSATDPWREPSDALRGLDGTVDENFQSLLELTTAGIDPHDVAEAQRFSRRFLLAWRERLLDRAARGSWVEGHGDLRAEHVVLDEGIEVVDCVEFDPALRRIDAAFDLAYLAMEVEAFGERGLADALLAGYRSAGGDAGEPPLFAFYSAQRAWIRAKVALVRARQLEAGEGAAGAQLGARLFAFGRRLAWRSRLPLALVVCGPPASGKSHLAGELALVSGIPYLNSDVVRKQLAGLEPTARAGPEHYTESFTMRTYDELAALAAEELRRSGGAIVDATYRRADTRRSLVEALAPTDSRVVFVECRAPRKVRAERARRRAASEAGPSDATAEIADRLALEFEPLDEVESGGHVAIRTDAPTSHALRELEARLDVALFDHAS